MSANRQQHDSMNVANGGAAGPSRRSFLTQFAGGLGALALGELLNPAVARADGWPTSSPAPIELGGILGQPHHTPSAKRVIYLFHSGGPSQMDLYDYKPVLKAMHGSELPDEIRMGQRLTAMTGSQASLPLVSSPFQFTQHGQSGAWLSEILPHLGKCVDDIAFIKSIWTESINHGPGVTHMQTGSQFPGRPSLGSWLSYGLGAENANLPAYVVMMTKNKGGQPLRSGLWGSAFLPSKHEGVRFIADKDPVLYLNNPAGIDTASRRSQLDALGKLHHMQLAQESDPQLESRIANYELAFRMQSAIPEATDLANEPQHTFDLYGEAGKTPGTYAANCILARRLAERGVRFIQLFHPGWDHHGSLPSSIRGECAETDQATAALLMDLKQRGLLQDTLVIWGGEFGRTNYCQGKLVGENFGRDHHPRCFTMWLAGGGVKGGVTYGSSDDLCYNVAENPVHVHDLQATVLHLLGIDHERLTYKYQGRRFRLTDVEGHVVKDVLA